MSSKQDLFLRAVMCRLNRCPSALLKKIARELHVSTRTLQNAVKWTTGKTFRELRDEMLMGQVKNFLESDPTCAIKELSFELGYKSPRSFARAIKQACGFSPAQLRSRIISQLLQDEKQTV